MLKKLIIIGAGGLGRECAQYVEDINHKKDTFELLGFADDDGSKKNVKYNNIAVLGSVDEMLMEASHKEKIYFFCAVANPKIKKNIAEKIKSYNLQTVNIIHPTSYISPSVDLGINVLIAPNCVFTTNIKLGDYVHINPQCGIGHDVKIADYSTLYWNVTVGGFVSIGKECELGSKTFVKQGIKVENEVISGAGAVIVKNIECGRVVKGVPAI